jgi:hypothetical protein
MLLAGEAQRADIELRQSFEMCGSLRPLSKSPTHIDPRKTRLDMELRLHHTMGFDKSHVAVHGRRIDRSWLAL